MVSSRDGPSETSEGGSNVKKDEENRHVQGLKIHASRGALKLGVGKERKEQKAV